MIWAFCRLILGLAILSTHSCVDGQISTTATRGVGKKSPSPEPTSTQQSSEGYRDLLPVTSPLSENSVQLSWVAPSDTILRYDFYVSTSKATEPDTSAAPHTSVADGTATSVILTDINPGSYGRVVVRARVSDSSVRSSVGSSVYWTPFGALNQGHVNDTRPMTTGFFSTYTEAAYVSPTFSMLTGSYYAPEMSYIFNKVPANGDRPIYNWGSLTVRKSSFSSDLMTDWSQIWSDGTKMAVSQAGGRILIYNQLPVSPDKMVPALVLGQSNMLTLSANAGGSVTGSVLSNPNGVCFNGTTLYVADTNNHRILGWNGWPTQTGQAADFVLGQPNFTSSSANQGGPASLSTFYTPSLLDCSNGKLVVTDSGNNRVLIWNTGPTVTATAASIVLGQSSASADSANGAGGVALGGLNAPRGVLVMSNGAGNALLVTDMNNHRVVQWDTFPTADGEAFDRVYGQADLMTTTANAGGKTINTMSQPHNLTREVGSNRFWVSDFSNGRYVIYELNSATATSIWGQASPTVSTDLYHGSMDLITHSIQQHSTYFGAESTGSYEPSHQHFAIDPDSGEFAFGNRLWPSPPTSNTQPTMWRGAGDLYTMDSLSPKSSTSGGFISYTTACFVTIGSRKYWCNTNRILSKAGDFSTGREAADLILGREDMTGANVTAGTNDFVINPTRLARVGTALLAVDGARIVGWLTPASASNQVIDFALGQPTLLANTANNGGVSASTLSASVSDILVSGSKLFVVDRGNNRVLIWNDIESSLSTAAPANVVIGQSSFTSNTSGTGQAEMLRPYGITVIGSKLFIADRGNSRLLVYDSIPTSNGVAASRIVDTRTMFKFSLPSWFNTDVLTPSSLGSANGRLYMGMYDRILVVPDVF